MRRSAGSIGANNYVNAKQFIIDVSTAFTVGLSQSRIGVVRFGDIATLAIPLNASTDITTLSTLVRNQPYGGGFTNTWDAIRMATTELQAGGRPISQAIPKIAFIVTDGQSQTLNVRGRGPRRAVPHHPMTSPRASRAVFLPVLHRSHQGRR